jgi:hypothetical protein
MIAVYVAHQYGGDPANRAAAAKWVAFFASLGYAPIADWIVLTGEWDESMLNQGLAIDCELVERADVMAMVGPSVSGGMTIEQSHASDYGTPSVELVCDFPATPAEMSPEQALDMVRRINSAVVTRRLGF